jgi:hypothetical protein
MAYHGCIKACCGTIRLQAVICCSLYTPCFDAILYQTHWLACRASLHTGWK